jgi:hypothetical protein
MDKNLKVDEDVAGRCELTQMEALAYALWGERGCPVGSPEVDWFVAQRRLSLVDESADAQGA